MAICASVSIEPPDATKIYRPKPFQLQWLQLNGRLHGWRGSDQAAFDFSRSSIASVSANSELNRSGLSIEAILARTGAEQFLVWRVGNSARASSRRCLAETWRPHSIHKFLRETSKLQGPKNTIFVASFADESAAAEAAKNIFEQLGAKLTTSIRDGVEVWTIKRKTLDKLEFEASAFLKQSTVRNLT
jgi:hypothetical protein